MITSGNYAAKLGTEDTKLEGTFWVIRAALLSLQAIEPCNPIKSFCKYCAIQQMCKIGAVEAMCRSSTWVLRKECLLRKQTAWRKDS